MYFKFDIFLHSKKGRQTFFLLFLFFKIKLILKNYNQIYEIKWDIHNIYLPIPILFSSRLMLLREKLDEGNIKSFVLSSQRSYFDYYK